MYYDDGKIKVRKAEKKDIGHISENMRQCDKDEVWASDHKTPEQALSEGLSNSIFACTVENGKPICMFGICPYTICGDTASVWMLATDDLDKIKRTFVRHSKEFVEKMLEYYPKLENMVDARNTKSIRWLKSIGAEMKEAENYGVEKMKFHYFCFKRSASCV